MNFVLWSVSDLKAVSMTDCPQNDICYRGGTEHYGINPICANNGHTYQNAAQLKCLQRYNSGKGLWREVMRKHLVIARVIASK